jgi:outer membrane protein OmpA-like peptidoglycan-associated protein
MNRPHPRTTALLLLALALLPPAHAAGEAPVSASSAASVATTAATGFTLKPPSPTPEIFGERDDFPYLSHPPGATLSATSIANDGLDVTTIDDADARIVGSRHVTKRYDLPPGTPPDTALRAYTAALRDAGWAVNAWQDRARGSALLVAHYAARGRDVWARLSAADGHFEASVADAGQGIANAFAQGCSLVLYGVSFDFDEAAPLAGSEPALFDVQRLLRADRDLKLQIVAHTDSRDAGGDREANLKLSAQRAEAVKLWFVRHRIDGDRLATRGAGDTEPLRPSDTEENRARNRRIELRKVGC